MESYMHIHTHTLTSQRCPCEAAARPPHTHRCPASSRLPGRALLTTQPEAIEPQGQTEAFPCRQRRWRWQRCCGCQMMAGSSRRNRPARSLRLRGGRFCPLRPSSPSPNSNPPRPRRRLRASSLACPASVPACSSGLAHCRTCTAWQRPHEGAK